MTRPFKVLGIQQIAIGGPSKEKLRTLWVEKFGLEITSTFVSERENVDATTTKPRECGLWYVAASLGRTLAWHRSACGFAPCRSCNLRWAG